MAFRFVKKLQFVKSKVKEWNQTKFGNIFANKQELEEKLAALQETIIQNGMSSESFLQERDLQNQYNEILTREEIYWQQKSREYWLKEGDKNTKFFHNSVEARRSWNKITSIHNKGNVLLENLEDINSEVISFFLTLFSKEGNISLEDQQNGLNAISKLIIEAQNQALMKPIQFDEVRRAVFSMMGDKA
ncbi:uncharacterized protein LOC131071390 [Cryptomeria japonica]|uniref:uncharacterized protein LOC131071390 n=1 Tax=Cryptomeria japonica TaxID=3369 RepID=UPI0027D9F315|nr:uncharacterized protein LOC131071390 [Cryptomeria japonica]